MAMEVLALRYEQSMAESIRFQLRTILQSEEFSASNRLRNFLQFIVEETLAGREESLKAYTIATTVFGRKDDFDSLLDPVVRVEAGKLRQRLNSYYFTREGKHEDKIRIDIPKGSYIPAFWEVENNVSATVEPNDKKTDALTQKCSLAVLPFVNIGEAKEIDYLLSGLAEELAAALTKFADLTVVSAWGMDLDSDIFKSPDDVVGSRLSVRFIIHGSAQRVGDGIRIRINLTDAVSRKILWADRFESEYTVKDFFDIIDAIVSQVASRIGDSFGTIKRTLFSEVPEAKRTEQLQAFEAVLCYHHWAVSLDTDRFNKAKEALEQAIKSDPNYALACGMLADIYATHYQWSAEAQPEYLERSEKLATQALKIDPKAQWGLWGKAYNHFLRGEKDEFLNFARQAISVNPSDTYLTATAGLKIALSGNWDEGRKIIAAARTLNPFLPSWFHTADCLYFLCNKDYPAALLEAKQVSSPSVSGPILRAAIYGAMGLPDRARLELSAVEEICPAFFARQQEIVGRMFYSSEAFEAVLAGLAKIDI